MFPNSGYTSRPCGRSIFLRLDTFLARNLMWRLPTRFTRRTFFFYLMTSYLAGKKNYKYALTVVDIARRYKEAEPLTSKNSDEVARAFQSIYRRSPLTWPNMLQVDPGREFMGAVTKEMEKHKLSSDVVALKFTEIRELSSVSIARLLSVCLAISMP